MGWACDLPNASVQEWNPKKRRGTNIFLPFAGMYGLYRLKSRPVMDCKGEDFLENGDLILSIIAHMFYSTRGI